MALLVLIYMLCILISGITAGYQALYAQGESASGDVLIDEAQRCVDSARLINDGLNNMSLAEQADMVYSILGCDQTIVYAVNICTNYRFFFLMDREQQSFVDRACNDDNVTALQNQYVHIRGLQNNTSFDLHDPYIPAMVTILTELDLCNKASETYADQPVNITKSEKEVMYRILIDCDEKNSALLYLCNTDSEMTKTDQCDDEVMYELKKYLLIRDST